MVEALDFLETIYAFLNRKFDNGEVIDSITIEITNKISLKVKKLKISLPEDNGISKTLEGKDSTSENSTRG